jgi:hypothetical protein
VLIRLLQVQRNVSVNDTKKLHADAERLSSLFRKRHCTVAIANLQDVSSNKLILLPGRNQVYTYTKIYK